MKRIFKSIVAFFLGLAARGVVRRYRPKIVMVTGSVGKTSTKDAVAAALSAKYFVRKSEKSFNSEFGVPFTIFGAPNPWGHPLAWFRLAKSALALLVLPNHYPTLLVLEVGADRPGDLARILKIATPDAVVVTRLPDVPVHVEAYTSPEAVREEEFSPALALRSGAPLVVAASDPYARELAARTSAQVITFGTEAGADVRVCERGYAQEEGVVVGMAAEAELGGEKRTVVIRGSVGRTQLLPTAAALAVAKALEVPPGEALDQLAAYEPPPGRGRLFAGKNGSVIIDDSYNASPAAVEEALATLQAFPHARRRIAALGDMLELGRYSVAEHERIGATARAAADLVAAVGVRARAYASAAGKAEVIAFENARTAGEELARIASPGDVILVKGSQSMRMERVVEALLADPADATRLVRQEKEWKRKA